jgi:uncharacterized cysteine cluster protein YcgN (CxxCxxCC family)
MTCRDCKLFDIESAKDKAGRVRKANAVKCLWVSKEQYPISVSSVAWSRPTAGYVTSDRDNKCPCFQKRV